MARPKKTGLDYFPMDVDVFDDYKIIDLLNEYGSLGFTIYHIVISKVYKNGYYLEIPLDKLATQIVRIIGNRWIKDKNLVLQVIQYCADIGLFDNALLTQSVITSVGIQRRYSEVTVRNKVDKSKYWLLEKNTSQVALVNAPKNRVSATKTPVSATKTQINATSIPQKESKLNKSKLNESRCAVSIPLRDGSMYEISENTVNQLQQLYPDIRIIQSLRKMADFLYNNDSKRRDYMAMDNYIRWWLEQDSTKAQTKVQSETEQKKQFQSEEHKANYDISFLDGIGLLD